MKHYNIVIDNDKIIDIQPTKLLYNWKICDYIHDVPVCGGEYIVSIADDHGDNILYYTTVATWHSGLKTWIKDSEIIPDNFVQYWTELPQPYRR